MDSKEMLAVPMIMHKSVVDEDFKEIAAQEGFLEAVLHNNTKATLKEKITEHWETQLVIADAEQEFMRQSRRYDPWMESEIPPPEKVSLGNYPTAPQLQIMLTELKLSQPEATENQKEKGIKTTKDSVKAELEGKAKQGGYSTPTRTQKVSGEAQIAPRFAKETRTTTSAASSSKDHEIAEETAAAPTKTEGKKAGKNKRTKKKTKVETSSEESDSDSPFEMA